MAGARKVHSLPPCGLNGCGSWESEKQLEVQEFSCVYYCQINARNTKKKKKCNLERETQGHMAFHGAAMCGAHICRRRAGGG